MKDRINHRTASCSLFAVCLLAPMVSCQNSRHAANPRTEEPARFLLIIEASSRRVRHSWQPAADFDLSRHAVCSSAVQANGRIVLAAARPRHVWPGAD